MSTLRSVAVAARCVERPRCLRHQRQGAGDPDPRQSGPWPRRREPEPKPPVRYVEVPTPLPLPGQLKPVGKEADKKKDARPPSERVTGANAAARVEPVKDGYINAIQVYPYTKGALYQLYAAVNQVTDIALEAGEKLVSVSAGDTVRWVVGDTTSGEGKDAQVHILVKPIGADLETNLVITTDRRTYHLEMRSSDKTYMASVSWTYPAAELVSLRKQRDEAAASTRVDRRQRRQHRPAALPLSHRGRRALEAAPGVR